MESTGVYWKPVYYVLEERFTCLLVNAVHVKRVPGWKTDVQDCAWLAQLLEHGLLRAASCHQPRSASSVILPDIESR
jgi:transposase